MLILRLNLLLALCLFVSLSAYGGRLTGQSFEFYGEEQPLSDVLTAIATHSRLGIRVNEDIEVDFSGHLKQRNSLEALNYLAASFDLVWYNDGATLFIDPINAMESRLFQLDKIAARQIKSTMQNLSIWDGRFEWRSLSNSAILMVSGPPRYLELVEETIDLLKAQHKVTSEDGLDVKIFKLKYAVADDRRVEAREEEIILPGVATLLQGLLVGSQSVDVTQDQDKVSTGFGSSSNQDLLDDESENESSSASKEESDRPQNRAKNIALKRSKASAKEAPVKGSPHPQAAIYADPSTNSIIVQDYSSRLAMYSKLISQLDVPKQQLEISLLIIDLTASSLFDLGVNWTTATQQRANGLLDLILPGASDAATEVLGQTNADFLATVTALESKGEAKVTSRPAVVTENGMEALLDNNETFFVRVQGERVASLEEVTFGTLLQVVPRVVGDEEIGTAQFINLDVKIEDGSRLVNSNVDALPSIRNTQITTRSSVPNGGSLLIGGYYREATTSSRDGIPVLGRLPVVGNLFSRVGDSSSQLVRLFMLSPRILSDSVFDTGPAYSEDTLSYSQQIRQAADLSNYNPEIKRLRYKGECESSLNARQRRNSYRNANVPTRIVPCRADGPTSTYRVITL